MNEKMIKPEYLVVKSNLLIWANYNLSLQEQKIILMLASLVKPDDSEFYAYTFQIKEFMELLEIKNKNSYREIANITKGLMKKVFEIRDEEKNTLLQLAWFSSALYKYGEGIVELKFSPHLKPYLLQLKSFYTKYKLKNVLILRSKYSIRIYEILKCYAFKRQFIIPIDEFKKITGGIGYKDNSAYKRRVLKPAQKEINKLTDIFFTYSELKKGNKIIAISFTIKDKEIQAPIIQEYDEKNICQDEIIIDIKNKIIKITKSNIAFN